MEAAGIQYLMPELQNSIWTNYFTYKSYYKKNPLLTPKDGYVLCLG